MVNKNICVCTKTYSVEFDTYEELMEWAKKEIGIKVNDLVEVIDTGFCYNYISNSVCKQFYQSLEIDIDKYTDIINHLNHKSLGYSKGIYHIDSKDCVFKVIAELDNKYIIEATEGDKYLDYMEGYYIIGKKGVKKCVI